MNSLRKQIGWTAGICALSFLSVMAQEHTAADIRVTASSVYKNYNASNAIDGKVSDDSRWIGGKDENGKIWLGLRLDGVRDLAGVQLHSGYGLIDAVDSFYVETKNRSGEWEKVLGSTVTENRSINRVVPFASSVSTKEVRIVITKTKDDLARVKEVVLLSENGTGNSVRVSSSGDGDTVNSKPVSLNSGDLKVHSEPVALEAGDYTINIDPCGFRFNIVDDAGITLAPMHHSDGLRIGNESVFLTKVDPDQEGVFTVATTKGQEVTVKVTTTSGVISVAVEPQKGVAQNVSLSLGGMPVAYGLGDRGGYSRSLNLVSWKSTSYDLKNNGTLERWQSSFVVFPQNQLAGVVFDGKSPSVTLGAQQYTMSVSADTAVNFHYFVGDMQGIYRNYRDHLDKNGFPNVKPKSRLFELGWESWAALGWNTNATTVLKSVTDFQKMGYPVRWAVTGSGFWDTGGTTTSFGKFGKTFPNPAGFKNKMNERDVKWMIGMRTNLVLPGGPHTPKTKHRDGNLKVKTTSGNPLSTVGLEKDYFVKDSSGNPLAITSTVFPLVPCYMVDGHKPEAVDWYANLYKQWDVDGIKEDTMMNLGGDHLDIFNAPISRLADDGALVMARCGSFSSAGTLLRINDTKVSEVRERIPVNYLQYAACGAPNVYSDTVGFHKMKSYSDIVIRHAWLMGLTAGMAIGESPSQWEPHQQELFKKPFDFHYKIVPYLYDAAMKSHQTGYPYTMTPLGVAYAGDKDAATTKNFQWMAGESLLCVPQCKAPESSTMDIYLPEGVWFDYDTGKKYQGPQLLKGFAMPVDKTPCFVGGKGVLVARSSDDAPLQAHIYPVENLPETYTFNHMDGKSTTTLRQRKGSESGVWATKSGEQVDFKISPVNGALSFIIEPGKVYEYAL